MAFDSNFSSPSPCTLLKNSSSVLPRSSASVSFRSLAFNRRRNLSIRSVSTQAPSTAGGIAPAISLTDDALKHLNKMRSDRKEDLCLRIGVKQGGCSGMSYTMEFESKEDARPDDSIMEYNGFVIVCDPKSRMGCNWTLVMLSLAEDSLSKIQMLHKPVDVVNHLLQRCEGASAVNIKHRIKL